MPSKSVAEIEQEIYEAMLAVDCAAFGLWCKMRALIDRLSDRPGHLRRDGQSMNLPALAQWARLERDMAPRLLRDLESVGLVKVDQRGYIQLPHLIELSKVRQADAERQRRGRQRRRDKDLQGVTNTRCHTDVTNHPPPQVSPPYNPPLPSPPPEDHHSAREVSTNGDELDSRIRVYIGGLRKVMYDQRKHSNVRKMVESGGWNGMVEVMDDAIARGAAEPTSYALASMTSAQAQRRIDARRKSNGPASNGANPPLNATKRYDA